MATTGPNARFWNKAAAKYATRPVPDTAAYEKTLARTAAHLKSTDTAFEFGCGTGTTALKLAPSVARYVATDLSDAMIAIGKDKAAAANATNIDFVTATPEDSRWPDGTFDAAIAFNVLHLIKDRDRVLEAVHRILKPGGLFISKTPCLSEMNFFMGGLARAVVGGMQLAGRAPDVAFFSAKRLEAEMASTGFRILEREFHATKSSDIRPFLVAQRM